MIYFLRHDDKLTPDKKAFQITVWFKFVFAYILISVLDRLVKRSGIKKDLSISNKEESIQKMIMTTNEDNIETSSLFEKRQHNYSINTNIKYFSYKITYYETTLHSFLF